MPSPTEVQNRRDIRDISRDPLRKVSELIINNAPIAPHFLQSIIHSKEDRMSEETSIYERIELCHLLHAIEPNNPIWNEAATFFSTYPRSADVAVSYLHTIGISRGKDRTIQLSPEWKNRRLPIEFMDIPHWLPKGKDTRFLTLAEKLARDSWNGYNAVKRDLTAPKENVSLLIQPAVNKTLEACRLSGCNTVCVIGISEDEVNAFKDKGVTVVGFNIGNSPKLNEMINHGDVISLEHRYGTINERTLEKGRCYIVQGDVINGLPFNDGSVAVMVNFVLHHVPFDKQLNVMREIARVAAPIGNDMSHRKAFVIGEDSNSFDLTLIKLSLNPAVTAWDAVMSQVRGVLTVEQLRENKSILAKQGMLLSFSETPDFPLPFKLLGLGRIIMPVSQILVAGY